MYELIKLRNTINSALVAQESHNYYLFNVDGEYSESDLAKGEERVATLKDVQSLIDSQLNDCIDECNLVLTMIDQSSSAGFQY
jgi:hypothetical protein